MEFRCSDCCMLVLQFAIFLSGLLTACQSCLIVIQLNVLCV
jgi:hypothetical protein